MPSKPVPTKTKIQRGNPGKRRLPSVDEEPSPDSISQLPEAPEWLGEYGKAEWRRVGPVLIDAGLLTVADLKTFAAYCENVHIMIKSSLDIEDKGMTIIGARGRTRNPSLATFAAASTNLRQFAAEFGMTPSSRSRISLPGDDGESLEDLLGANTKEDAE